MSHTFEPIWTVTFSKAGEPTRKPPSPGIAGNRPFEGKIYQEDCANQGGSKKLHPSRIYSLIHLLRVGEKNMWPHANPYFILSY